MNGGIISDNIATVSGGGIAIASISGNKVEINGGEISRNKANGTAAAAGGGGIFVTPAERNKLTIGANAAFSGNTAVRARWLTEAQATEAGHYTPARFAQPWPFPSDSPIAGSPFRYLFNNYDISDTTGWITPIPYDPDPDWARLRRWIDTPNVETIIIHGSTSTQMERRENNTVHFVIQDNDSDGRTIDSKSDVNTGAIDITRNLTIESGDDGDIILLQSGSARHFNIEADVTALTFDGKIILDGGSREELGGGILIDSGGSSGRNFILTNAVIENCRADQGGGIIIATGNTVEIIGGKISDNTATGSGGGILVNNSSTVTLNGDVKITGNKSTGTDVANGGGGIGFGGWLNINSDDVIISGNSAANFGGGIFLLPLGQTNLTMSAGTISGNSANFGGVIMAHHNSRSTISGGKISDNTAAVSGGGIMVSASAWYVIIRGNVEISGNKSTGTADTDGGGGIFAVDKTKLNIANTVKFSGNTAVTARWLRNTGDEAHIAAHISMFGEDRTSWPTPSAPPATHMDFEYLFNNYDINQATGGETEKYAFPKLLIVPGEMDFGTRLRPLAANAMFSLFDRDTPEDNYTDTLVFKVANVEHHQWSLSFSATPFYRIDPVTKLINTDIIGATPWAVREDPLGGNKILHNLAELYSQNQSLRVFDRDSAVQKLAADGSAQWTWSDLIYDIQAQANHPSAHSYQSEFRWVFTIGDPGDDEVS
jgi:hypothetical protein